jgi:hypothetical protein
MANRKDSLRLVVIESRFTLTDRKIFFGRAKLLPDRVILKALGYRETISLEEIADVRWQGGELVIVLKNGDEYELMIDSAPMWKLELQSRCHLHDNSFGTSVRKLNELSLSGGSDSGEDFSDESTLITDISGNGHAASDDSDRDEEPKSGDETDGKPSWYHVNRLFDPGKQ